MLHRKCKCYQLELRRRVFVQNFKESSIFSEPFPLFFPPLIIPKPLANSNPNKQTKKKREKSQLKPLNVIFRMLNRLHRRRHHLSIFEISITHTSVPTPLSRSVPFSPISNAVLRVSPTRGKSTHTYTHTEENCLSRGRERAGRHFAALLAICGGGGGFKGWRFKTRKFATLLASYSRESWLRSVPFS